MSRVTDLMELLDSVESAKAEEYTNNFQDSGPSGVIEFRDVTIGAFEYRM